MKKNTLILLLFLASSAGIYAQKNSYEWMPNPLIYRNFDYINFVSKNIGFCASKAHGKKDILLKTIDGGTTWKELPVTFEDITSINAINENVIWIGTKEEGLFNTKNGGVSWQNSNPSKAFSPYYLSYDFIGAIKVNFLNELNGYVQYRNYVAVTQDGGKTWKPLKREITNISKNFVLFASEKVIYDVKMEVVAGLKLHKTVNGGTSWVELKIPKEIKTAFKGASRVPKMYFINEKIGFIMPKYDNYSYYFKTIDGGLQWKKVQLPFSSSYNFHFTNTVGYLVSNNKLYKSLDKGSSWNLVSEIKDIFNTKIHLTNSTFYITNSQGAIRVLNGDTIKHLIDGHRELTAEGFFYKNYLYFIGSTRAVKGKSYKTFAKYNTNNLQITTSLPIKEIKNDSLTRSTVKFGGRIVSNPNKSVFISLPKPCKSTDEMKSWIPLFDDIGGKYGYNFNELEFSNNTTAFAIDDNTIYKSTNAGNRWNKVFERTKRKDDDRKYYFSDIQVLSENHIIIIGDGNLIYETKDAGNSWKKNKISKNDAIDFDKIHFLEGNKIGWLYNTDRNYTGKNYIFKTVNGALSWVDTAAKMSENIYDIKFSDKNNGYMLCNYATYVTKNGGSSWEKSKQSSYTKINFVSKNSVLAGSYLSRLLKKPECVSNITHSFSNNKKGTKTIKVSWDVAKNKATFYNVYLTYKQFSEDKIHKLGKTSSNSYTFENFDVNEDPSLKNAKAIKIRVVPNNLNLENTDCSTSVNVPLNTLSVSNKVALSKKDDVLLYPNPSNGILSLETHYKVEKVQLFSTTGKLILNFYNKNSINIENVSSGIYFVKMFFSNGTTSTKKVIKN